LATVAQPSTSAELILEATRSAIAARGSEKLTLSAVAVAAGVSRPTLYRWFPTKTDLFAALAEYETRRFDAGLQAAVAAHRTPARRLDAALRYLVTYLDESLGSAAIDVDPAFALEGLAEGLEPHVDALVRLLGDAFAKVPAVRTGALSREQAAEIFLRIAYSHYLVPHSDSEVLLAAMRSFAGLPRRSMTRIAG
jgi:AcrR family transcriptional regulator